ncbi:hypothetical protein BGW38_009528 [Lunasporangiospora selenospora]|uniref:Arrestin-like N-terminal domain-containing protein n=1 Tax=Lunasporangiospora selenospora TaxID=979761 RepID=A0A9P6FXS1_9FUNG|nr:hypothetical protein BGW38_009528 [Lunasporangiospora selenospora]
MGRELFAADNDDLTLTIPATRPINPPPFSEASSSSPPRQGVRFSPTVSHSASPSTSPSASPSATAARTSSSPVSAQTFMFAPTNTQFIQSMTSPFSFFSNGHLSHGESGNNSHLAYSPQGIVGPPPKTLRIELPSHDVVLMTGRTTKLEGIVYLTLLKPTKVKSLHLEFSGRSSVTWVDDSSFAPAIRHSTAPHIEHTWFLISHEHKQPPTLLQPGQHAFPFSLDLPDTLPESLSLSHGRVSYRLSATLTKPGISFNPANTSTNVYILRRYPANSQLSRQFQQGSRVVGEPDDKIQYRISVPQVRVPLGSKLPLQVTLISPGQQTTVQVLQVGLWECVVYNVDGRERVDLRLVKIQKSEGWPHEIQDGQSSNDAVTWSKVLLFDMPAMGPELNQCNPSTDNTLMKVTHLLRFTILGCEGAKRYRIERELHLMTLAFEDEEERLNVTAGDEELPSYLTSFTTPRVSLDSERDLNLLDDDVLRGLVDATIHLPTYDESEVVEMSSRNPSRDGSRSNSPERPSPGLESPSLPSAVSTQPPPMFTPPSPPPSPLTRSSDHHDSLNQQPIPPARSSPRLQSRHPSANYRLWFPSA